MKKKRQTRRVRSGRLPANLASAALTCLALAASVLAAAGAGQNGGGSFARDINAISENLDRALYNVLEDITGPDYTPVNVTARYGADARFDPRGMAGLYNITNMFVDVLISRDIYPEGLIEVTNGDIQLGSIEDQWQALLTHFAGLLAVIIIILLVAVFMPLCGFFFCCCRCCGRCGARPEPLDKRKDCCRKFFLATLLIVAGTGLLFGVVCSFVTSQHMKDGGNELIPNVRTGLEDINTYIKSTGEEVTILLKVNYREFQDDLFTILDKSSSIVYDQLAMYSNAVAMTQVSAIVDGLDDIKTNLTNMKTITFFLRNHASQLNDALRKVKRDLIYTLKQCYDNNACAKLSNSVQELEMSIDFNQLPDVTDEMTTLEAILKDHIVDNVAAGKENLQRIEDKINEAVSTSLEAVRAAVAGAGARVADGAANATRALDDVARAVRDRADRPLRDAERLVAAYLPYWYYAGVGISCALLVVALAIAFGLVCGVCGKKPDHYTNDCCNKGVGSRCLICGVGVMFLTAIVIAAVTIVCFVVGVFGQRLVCDSVRNYNDSKVIDLLDEYIEFGPTLGVDLTIKSVLEKCHRNDTVYNVFQLSSQFDLSKVEEYFNDYDIGSALQQLEEHIHVNDLEIEILSEPAKQNLENLANSNIADINFDSFTQVLDYNLTKVDLKYLISQLDLVIQAVKKHRVEHDIQGQLQVSKLHLETYQQRLVDPMTEKAERLIDIAKNMEENLKFGRSSFKEAIRELIREVEEAEEFLKVNGKVLLKNIATNFTMAIKNQVDGYIDRVVLSVETEIGQCGPLSNVVNATLTATCDQILLPMNGFWFVLFWSLLLFIILIILSVKLASLYQKFDPYSYPGEAEYLYDAYADREIIPLASNGKPNKKKKKNKENRGNFPNEMGDHPGARRDYPSGSGQDNRYSDMTPRQHWEDFPNGGPPQYQRAPTEYDRPPPYNYYPGNAEQQ